MTPETRSRLEMLAKKALAKWGATAQMNMLQEECAEVIVAISHMRRGRVGTEAVAEEFADIIIMAEQARQVLAPQVAAALEKKLDRLEERLKS